jgi:putative cardiolipin synthase
VLTNALAATDVGPVHAGYSKYREDLLRGGIRIYELKPGANVLKRDRQPDKGIGSSSSSLHAKTFGSDRNRIFVGSFNLDPRSANLNTEMGIVIDSAVLATRLSETLDTAIPLEAYELRLAATGSGLQWVERTAEGEMVHTTEPESSLLRRIWVRFLSILPIEWLL